MHERKRPKHGAKEVPASRWRKRSREPAGRCTQIELLSSVTVCRRVEGYVRVDAGPSAPCETVLLDSDVGDELAEETIHEKGRLLVGGKAQRSAGACVALPEPAGHSPKSAHSVLLPALPCPRCSRGGEKRELTSFAQRRSSSFAHVCMPQLDRWVSYSLNRSTDTFSPCYSFAFACHLLSGRLPALPPPRFRFSADRVKRILCSFLRAYSTDMADHQTSKQDAENSSSSVEQQDGEPVVWTEQEETSIRRKTDRHLMPLLWALFM